MIEGKTLAAILLMLSTTSLSVADKEVREKSGKVFSLFSVVTFPNDQCTAKSSTSSATQYGTCLSNTECSNNGGTIDGNCASGFGVCCTYLVSACSSSISNNCTYVQNPSYPSSYTTAGDCAYNVKPISSDICQLRLDFDNFDITETLGTGACVDSFSVTTGSSRTYYTLCGTLTGQHIYLETARKTTDQILKFTIGATTTVATWRIKVAQVECFSTSKAPTDCYQYLTGVSGTITSLNYPNSVLEETRYTSCVRREAGYCGIQWSQTTFTSGDGSIAVVTPDPFALDTILTTGLALDVVDADSHITIPGSGNTAYGGSHLIDEAHTIAAERDAHSAAVYSTGLPFTLTFQATTGVAVDGLPDTTGFSLQYDQIPC